MASKRITKYENDIANCKKKIILPFQNSLLFPDVLNNLTTLEVLSMSGNKLEDKIFFKDGHSFGHLPNLTELELDHNLFTTLPTDALVKHKNLKKLNVGFNKIIRYDPEFTEQIKTGLEIEFEGMLFTKRKNFPTKSRNLFMISSKPAL